MTPTGARYPHGGLVFGDDKGVDLVDLTAELLAEPPEQFTSKRNARAKELKAAGQGDMARQLLDVKKPPLPLWAVNQVMRDDPATLRKVHESSQGVTKAQQATGRGRADAAKELRSASEELQRNLEAATTVAADALRRRGHAPTEETLRRIREIIRLAVTQDGDAWDRLKKGALASEPEPTDDLTAMFRAGSAPAAKPTKADEQAEARRVQEIAEREARADVERAQQLEATAKRLRNEAREATAAAERAEQRAKTAEDEAAAAKTQAQKSQRAIARRRS